MKEYCLHVFSEINIWSHWPGKIDGTHGIFKYSRSESISLKIIYYNFYKMIFLSSEEIRTRKMWNGRHPGTIPNYKCRHLEPLVTEKNWTLLSLEWTLLFLNLDMSTDANSGFSLKSKTEWQTVSILMRRLVTSRLIWIYTVCKGICFGLPGWKV